MTATAIFELLACILALVAAVFIFDQYRERPRPYKLLWTLGLLFYGIAAGAQFLGEVGHWSVGNFKAWYFFGGVLTAAYLGLGSLYLQAPRRVSRWAVIIAVLISVYVGTRILLLPINAAESARLATLPTSTVTGTEFRNIIPGDLVPFVALMNIVGALLLFGGAGWSAWNFYRKHAPGYRVVSMILMALGAIFASGTGLQRLGNGSIGAFVEFLGAVCILSGLLISLDVFTVFRVPFTHIVLRERRQATEVASQQR